jgi:hypothetical protein
MSSREAADIGLPKHSRDGIARWVSAYDRLKRPEVLDALVGGLMGHADRG